MGLRRGSKLWFGLAAVLLLAGGALAGLGIARLVDSTHTDAIVRADGEPHVVHTETGARMLYAEQSTTPPTCTVDGRPVRSPNGSYTQGVQGRTWEAFGVFRSDGEVELACHGGYADVRVAPSMEFTRGTLFRIGLFVGGPLVLGSAAFLVALVTGVRLVAAKSQPMQPPP